MRLFKDSISIEKGDPSFKLVMSYEDENNQTQYAEFDYLDESVRTTDEMSISQYPVAAGYNIIDHIFRQPQSLSFQATFADHGKKAYGWTDENRLGSIQAEFQRLQRAGTKFRLVMQSSGNSSLNKFREYRNMIITRLNWDQRQNIMIGSFEMKEAMTLNVSDYIEAYKDLSDPNLPSIQQLSQTSMMDLYFSGNAIETYVLTALVSADAISENVVRDYCMSKNMISSETESFLELIGLKNQSWDRNISPEGWAVMMAFLGPLALAIDPSGTLLTAGVTIAAAKTVNRAKLQKNGLWFKYTNLEEWSTNLGYNYTLDTEKKEVLRRLNEFISLVRESIENISSIVKMYAITTNQEQETSLSLGKYYFTIKIRKNNVSKKWKADLLLYGTQNKATSTMEYTDIFSTNAKPFYKLSGSESSNDTQNTSWSNSIFVCKNPTNNFSEDDLRSYMFVTCSKNVNIVMKEIQDFFSRGMFDLTVTKESWYQEPEEE